MTDEERHADMVRALSALEAPDLAFEEMVLAGVPRFSLDRTLHDGSHRYARVCVADAGITAVYGAYQTPDPRDEFDAPNLGSLERMVAFVKAWVVEARALRDCPEPWQDSHAGR